jgi:arylsulfatase A-like enzyme
VADKYEGTYVRPWNADPGVFERDTDADPTGVSDKPAYIQASRGGYLKGKTIRKKQMRTLRSVDDMMGRFRRVLREIGAQNTLVIFLSDNGYLWGSHSRIGKFVPYTQSIKVPMYASWPGVLPKGTKDFRITANVDIAPTVLEAAGLAPKETEPLDGRSFLNEGTGRDRLLTESFDNADEAEVPPWASLRTEDYQYIEYYGSSDEVVFREYYDLQTDPWQLVNVLGDLNPTNDPNPAQLASIELQLTQDRTCVGAQCP